MKNRFKAIILATGLTVSMLGINAYAEATTEEAAVEAAVEEVESEAAATTATPASEEEYYTQALDQTLASLSNLTDEEIQSAMDQGGNSGILIATWDNVREELGAYQSVSDVQYAMEGNVLTLKADAVYEKTAAQNATVDVEMTYDSTSGEQSMNWNVNYPMSKLMKEAGLNTLLGVGIVFAVLVFLSFLISRFKLISTIGSKKKDEKAAAKAAAPAPKAAPAPAVEEEELVDDGELVAVIAAAIAASENTTTDGFVVRSIRKANRRKWQNA